MTKTKNCDAKTLAVIAAQFIACGDDEEEALRKANALYLKATAYASEEEMRALGEREDLVVGLVIGDSEASSPALKYFRETAKTKLDKNITHKKFLKILERFHDHRPDKSTPWKPPEKINPGVLVMLHKRLRDERSRARSVRRKKVVENKRTKRGL